MSRMKATRVVLDSKITLDNSMIYTLQDMIVRIRPQKMMLLKTTHVPWYLER
jgi:hypothetical protein